MNVIKFFSIFLLIYCFMIQILFASDYDAMTLEECINLALENNPFIERKVKKIIYHNPKFLTLGCFVDRRILSYAALLFF